MNEAVVELLSLQQAKERRAALLAATGLDREELAQRAEDYLLDVPLLATWHQVEELDWLIEGTTRER